MKIQIDWQPSPFFGWGVYGINLALEWSKDPVIAASSCHWIVRPDELGLDALRAHALRPFASRSGWQRPGAITLHCLGNDIGPPSHIKSEVGVIFFELPLSPEASERAKAYELIIAGSGWNERMLRAAGIEHVKTVLQGVDPTIFHPAPKRDLYPGRFLIFSGGKAEPRKGQDLAVKAFRAFAQRHPEAMLVTAWHSPWPWLAKGMDLDLADLADRVIDVAATPNPLMATVYRECDVALFPNRAEGGTNLVAMECLACGVPSIISANTGHLDLLDVPGVVPLGRQTPHAIEEWRESDLEEILAALEQAFTGWQPWPFGRPPFDLTWSKTAGELLEAIKPLATREAVAA